MRKNNHNTEKLLCWIGKIPKLIQILILLACVLVSITLAYAALNASTEQNSQKLEKLEEKSNDNEKAIISMQKDIEYIKKGVDEIREELKNSRSKK